MNSPPIQICFQEYERHMDLAILTNCVDNVPKRYWNPPTFASDRHLGNIYSVYNQNYDVPSPQHSLRYPAYSYQGGLAANWRIPTNITR